MTGSRWSRGTTGAHGAEAPKRFVKHATARHPRISQIMADLAVIIRGRCVMTDDHRHVFGVASDSCRFEISGHDLKRGGDCGRSLVGRGLFVV